MRLILAALLFVTACAEDKKKKTNDPEDQNTDPRAHCTGTHASPSSYVLTDTDILQLHDVRSQSTDTDDLNLMQLVLQHANDTTGTVEVLDPRDGVQADVV